MTHNFEIVDIEPRTGVFDVKILNENGEKEVFTYDNSMKEDDAYIDDIKRRIRERNSEKLDPSEFEEKKGQEIEA